MAAGTHGRWGETLGGEGDPQGGARPVDSLENAAYTTAHNVTEAMANYMADKTADRATDKGADRATDWVTGRIVDRIAWLPPLSPDQYALLLAAADLMVDPYPFGGGGDDPRGSGRLHACGHPAQQANRAGTHR